LFVKAERTPVQEALAKSQGSTEKITYKGQKVVPINVNVNTHVDKDGTVDTKVETPGEVWSRRDLGSNRRALID
jgi:hypothetical protein